MAARIIGRLKARQVTNAKPPKDKQWAVIPDGGPADVLRIVEPIWNTKRETASRVRQRVERILDYATTREFRSGDNPAAHVTESLPKGGNGKERGTMPPCPTPRFPRSWRSSVLAIPCRLGLLSSLS
jgi:hypothetical protein